MEQVEKNSQILIEYSLKSKESKKNGVQLWAQMREKWLKKNRVLQIWTGFNELPWWTGWAGWKLIDPVKKTSQIFREYSLRSKESKKQKKTMCNSELKWERLDYNKLECSKFGWTSTSCPNEPVEPIEKNSQILIKYSFRSKESKKEKKMVHNSELG